MEQTFYAHGKLLLTAEYLVLDGAQALALPTQRGQSLKVVQDVISLDSIEWKSYDHEGKIWLEGVWSIEQRSWIQISDEDKGRYVHALLKYVLEVLQLPLGGEKVSTYLEFPNNWGLGSSSTLISLLAQWWDTCPYDLLKQTFGGSGYDIACATAESPILYQLERGIPVVKKVDFIPIFSNQIAFLFLEQKQNSREGINYYRSLEADKTTWIKEIDTLTDRVLKAKTIAEFEDALKLHESLLSEMLQMKTVKNRLFPDYPFVIKSLGAWGGDFVLVTHDGNFEKAQDYFQKLGYHTLIPYREMIYSI